MIQRLPNQKYVTHFGCGTLSAGIGRRSEHLIRHHHTFGRARGTGGVHDEQHVCRTDILWIKY